MDFELIKKIVKLIDQSGITDFTVEEGEVRIKISKRLASQSQSLPATHVVSMPLASQTRQEAEIQVEREEVLKVNQYEIRSPIVGTFYRAPSPEADPFVQVGDMISEGKVLCIIEAMKLMNEIESEVSGKVIKVLVENGKPVEYNQPLFLIEV